MSEFPVVRARRTLLASLVIVGMGFSVMFPLLAPIGRELGFSELQITAVMASSAMTVFLMSPFWGRMSDVWGRKRIMMLGLFGFSAGTVVFNSILYVGLSGMLVGIPLFVALCLSRILHAAIMSAAMPSSTAYMADITDSLTRTKGMGATGAANNLGAVLGPAISSLAFVSLLLPLWVTAFFALLNGLFVWRFLDEPPRHTTVRRPSTRLRYSDRRILPFIVVGMLMFVGFAIAQQTMAFRFQDAMGLTSAETARTFGFALTLSALSSLLAQGVIVQRMDLAPFTLLRLAMPLLATAFALFALFDTQLPLTIGMMILGLGMGLAAPGYIAGASLAVSPDEQGAVAGVAGSCGPLGFTLGPLIGGGLYQINPFLPYGFGFLVFLALSVATMRLGRK